MLVKNGDRLKRGTASYEVICADEKTFVIALTYYVEYAMCYSTDYRHLEAYSNDETINTLEQLRFIKEE